MITNLLYDQILMIICEMSEVFVSYALYTDCEECDEIIWSYPFSSTRTIASFVIMQPRIFLIFYVTKFLESYCCYGRLACLVPKLFTYIILNLTLVPP